MKALDDYLAHKDKTNKKTPVSQAKLDIHKIDEEIKAETVELSDDFALDFSLSKLALQSDDKTK
ncbi:hypothetical protein [Candidatus Enterovibrio escicola]|uniref:hypothetical protein n=1 Tax=Candidatus Enterovibrio escicola TaxID=1927127 RepID=UPI001237D7BE|nr:hypothetical protein [Candidatus Enterovibrio escacola]